MGISQFPLGAALLLVGSLVQPFAAEAPADPSQPGPYSAGVTQRTFVRTSSTTGEPRVLESLIWYPALTVDAAPDARLAAPMDVEPERSGAPYPVLVFSHGNFGLPWGTSYLTSHLASHGFVVIAPAHPGNTLGDCRPPCQPAGPAMQPIREDSAINRPGDLIAVLGHALALSQSDDPLLGGILDPARAGVLGHSFGGYTALVAVANEPRFRAAISMAPGGGIGPGRAMLQEAISKLSTPTMLMSAGRDATTPYASHRNLWSMFPQPGPANRFVVLSRAGHNSFNNRCVPSGGGCGPDDLPMSEAHRLISYWASAFMLHHIAGDERYAQLLDPAGAREDPEVIVLAPGARAP